MVWKGCAAFSCCGYDIKEGTQNKLSGGSFRKALPILQMYSEIINSGCIIVY